MSIGAGQGPVLAVSPHLDDAVLAVGATIAALTDAAREVYVVTVFAGVPQPPYSVTARRFHAECGLGDDAVERRRDEDCDAVRALGAEPIHLGHLDAIYRRRGGAWLCDGAGAVFDRALAADPALSAEIAADIDLLVRQIRPAEVWTCAAIGGHIDHLLTRGGVMAAGRQAGWTPTLWEGLPYAVGSPPPTGVRTRLVATLHDGHLDRKFRAVARYASQLGMLWPDGEDWRAQLRAHASSRAVWGAPELLWNVTETPRLSDIRPVLEVGHE